MNNIVYIPFDIEEVHADEHDGGVDTKLEELKTLQAGNDICKICPANIGTTGVIVKL
jgi:hypothetical protein